MSINKAVMPIAGLGTRLLPLTKGAPKEMLPINGVPILQLLIEEAACAGITEIVLVVSKQKEPIFRSYLSAKKGQITDSIKFHYVYQDQQLGDGHAILQAESLLQDEPFAVLFGDDIVIPKTAGQALSQLIEAYKKTSSSILALEEIPIEKSSSYGIIKPKPNSTPPLYEIEDLVEKPSPDAAPSNLGIIGKYVVTPEIFASLHDAESSVGGEIRLIDGFKNLIKTQPIYGLKIEGTRYDTGTLEGYRKAILEIQN